MLRWADTEQGNVELLAMKDITEGSDNAGDAPAEEKDTASTGKDETDKDQGGEVKKEDPEAVTVGTFGFHTVTIEAVGAEKEEKKTETATAMVSLMIKLLGCTVLYCTYCIVSLKQEQFDYVSYILYRLIPLVVRKR